MYVYTFICKLKGLTAGAADPDPISSRHAPRLRPRKAIVRRQSLWTIDVLEGSPRGPLGALGGPLGRAEAQGRSGVSERGSRGSRAVWGASLGSPKSLILGSESVIKIDVSWLGRFVMKRRDFQVFIVFYGFH